MKQDRNEHGFDWSLSWDELGLAAKANYCIFKKIAPVTSHDTRNENDWREKVKAMYEADRKNQTT